MESGTTGDRPVHLTPVMAFEQYLKRNVKDWKDADFDKFVSSLKPIALHDRETLEIVGAYPFKMSAEVAAVINLGGMPLCSTCGR